MGQAGESDLQGQGRRGQPSDLTGLMWVLADSGTESKK